MKPHPLKRVYVHTEISPNPHSLKFIVNKKLLPEGAYFDFPTVASAVEAPLARELFTYVFVARVFYTGDFIVVTKRKGIEWEEIKNTLGTHIKNFIASGQNIINSVALEKTHKIRGVGLVKQIKAILDKQIQPIVQRDGGSIVFHSYVKGVVRVRLQGACKGCPASATTLKAVVERIFKKMMPNEVTTVEALD